ncbi:HAD-like domain-containing protein [Baffinella frigidus]|nr:HAD-like domain-containing protein [Cryptophyta sp. CCMP2293]
MSAAGGIQLPPVICGAPPVGKRAIIFDIDGTLCDSSHMAMSATNRVLEEHGFPGVSPEEYHLGTRFTTPERLARHAGFSPGHDGERFHEQGKILGGKFDEMYIALVVDEQTAGFYPGIAQLIADVPPDVQLGALTNAAVAYAEAVLSANNVRQRFTVVHGADSVPRPKPYPDGLRVTLDEMGVSNTDAVYVGDAPSDAMAAARAGLIREHV